MVFADILQWLSQNNKTGILHLHSPMDIVKKIYFTNGKILSSSSSDPRYFLGHFLINYGLINEEQLTMAMQTQQETHIKLGKILITVGIIEEEELKKMLRLKAEETIYSIFLWEEGEFEFQDLETIDEDFVPIELDVISLVMEGVRRKDEWARILKVIPNAGCILKHTNKKLKRDSLNQNSKILRTYDAIDGNRTMYDISLELHATEFEVMSVAFRLMQKGLLEVKELKKEVVSPEVNITKGLWEKGRRCLEEGKYAEALNLFKYILKEEPNNKTARELMDKAEDGYCKSFFEAEVPLVSIPVLNKPLEKLINENLTPTEGFLASRINGTWDLASILKIAPMKEIEALKAFKSLYEKKIVSVKKR